jgi:molybdopterin molybdotransferase
MALPDVETALARMLELTSPLETEGVGIGEADGRWLAEPVVARREQPPFDASAMDGWAVRFADIEAGARLRIVGESAAGKPVDLGVGPGETARIFTGAALPKHADAIVIQETATRDGDWVILGDATPDPAWVRARGGDFGADETLLEAGLRLNPWRIALAASAGARQVVCGRAPRVAILPNGDELVEPGEAIADHQIFNAAGPALKAFAQGQGAIAASLPPASDDDAAIQAAVDAAQFDLLVTIGGASVGDHDRVKPALRALGAELAVEGCAMRPGKPVWFARLGDRRLVLGLPGNPASALVCAELFLAPLLARLQGGVAERTLSTGVLAEDLPGNGPRDHYMRARFEPAGDGRLLARPFGNQDSSLVTVMARADGLVRRPPNAPPAKAGDLVEILRSA